MGILFNRKPKIDIQDINMRKVLIVIDYQNDVVNSMESAKAIEDNLFNKIEEYKDLGIDGRLIYIYLKHRKEDFEEGGKLYPQEPFCVVQTEGWQLYGKVREARWNGDIAFFKSDIVSKELVEFLVEKKARITSLEICGVKGERSIRGNALALREALPDVEIMIDPKCIAFVDEGKREGILKELVDNNIKLI